MPGSQNDSAATDSKFGGGDKPVPAASENAANAAPDSPEDEAEGMLRVEVFVCNEGHEWDELAQWTNGAWVPLGPGCLKCKEAVDAAS